MTWQMLRDIGKYMNEKEKGLFDAFPVFRNSSPLWVALALETQKPNKVTGSGQLSDEPVFFLFNVYAGNSHESSLARHSHAWLNGLKD